MNQQYKTPTFIVKMWMRVGWFLFLVPAFMIMCNYDEMTRILIPQRYDYMGNATDVVIPTRYESLYAIDYLPKY